MTIPGAELTKAEVDQIAWQEVVAGCSEKECSAYEQAFYEKAREAQTAGNTEAEALFALLGIICSFHLKLDEPDEPFVPALVFQTGRSPSPEDLSDAHLDLLQQLAPEVADPELRARVADVIWVCRRNFQMAVLAVEAYLASASVLEDPEHWPTGFERIERALQLGASLGRNHPVLQTVIAYIEDRLAYHNGADPLFLSAKLMELLQEQRRGDPAIYAPLAERMALQAEAEHKWHKARTCWSILGRWRRVVGDTALDRDAQVRLAETYVLEAEAALAHNPTDYGLAAHHLQQAIAALRRVGGTSERVAEIHHRLLEYQRQSAGQAQVAMTSIDVSEMAEQARGLVAGKEPLQALVSLAMLARPIGIQQIRDEVRRLVRNHAFQFIFPAVMLNEEGKVVARRPATSPSEIEADEALLRAEMFRQANWHRETLAVGGIEHARQQINLEHHIRVQDLLPIVAENPFIPLGRELMYAHGLHAGLTGDFLTAAHLLIPQIEHSLRTLLAERGALVSGIDTQGIQDEHNINAILYREELKAILGENIVFDLQGLLVERFGHNMRNRMAHGLMSAGEFFNGQSIYLWWLTLHLCCLPIAPQILGHAPAAASASPNDSGSSETSVSEANDVEP